MEILKHHVWNLRSIARGATGEEASSRIRQHSRSMIRWSIEGTDEAAYPGLQTEAGFNTFDETKQQMFGAIQSGDYTELDDKQTDGLCRTCGNLTPNGCRLKGKTICPR